MLAVAGHTNCRNRLGWWVRDGFVLDTRSTPIPCRSEVLESSVHGQGKNTWRMEQLALGRVVSAGVGVGQCHSWENKTMQRDEAASGTGERCWLDGWWQAELDDRAIEGCDAMAG